jgi:hypothetical protein
MPSHSKRDKWLQDVESRQRNIVFPDTVQNEARFWRNLGTGPSKLSTKLGLGVLAIFVFASAAMILVATYQVGVVWLFILGMLLFCGTFFGAIAWATRKSLGNMKEQGAIQVTKTLTPNHVFWLLIPRR